MTTSDDDPPTAVANGDDATTIVAKSPLTVAAEQYSEASTTIVPDVGPAQAPELAWSSEADTAELADRSHRCRGRLLWAALVVLLCASGTVVVWFSVTLYRQHQTVAAPPAVSPTVTAPLAQVAPPPVAPIAPPPPVEAPHPAPKYPWVAIVVAVQARPSPIRSISSGYGFTQDMATQSALISCHDSGHAECSEEASIADACIAVAVGAHGEYLTAVGPTRVDATATAKANAPWATAVQPFCSWDGNGVPEISTSAPVAAPPTPAGDTTP